MKNKLSRFWTPLILPMCLLVVSVVFLGAGCSVAPEPEGGDPRGAAGMYISLDKGDTWQTFSTYPTAEQVGSLTGVSVYRVFDDPQDSRAFYWASRGNGLFYTLDAGKTWQRPQGPVSSGFIFSVAVHPEKICTVYVSTGNQVYKTEDCMRTWSEVFRETRPSVNASSLSFSQQAPYDIFLASTNGDLHKSTDGGDTWTTITRLGVVLDKVLVDPFDSNYVYLASRENGLFVSTDGGQTWPEARQNKRIFAGYTGGNTFHRFFVSPSVDGRLYWICRYGIILSNDRGETWTPLTLLTPPNSIDIYAFAENPDDPNEIYYTATVGGRSTLYRSKDMGESWSTATKLPTQQVPTALRVHPDNSDVLYLGFTIWND